MESTPAPTATTPTDPAAALKRKRSPSATAPSAAPAAKAAKPAGQLSINYLARQSHDDLPLINRDDALPGLLALLSSYSNILDRHESLASNLGARPLGPILIKRFERCFDAPPRVVASHHRGSSSNHDDSAHSITWLEVIEFARAHPGQFTLSTFSEGKRVCQFYYPQKQLRVQISEEDFLFINSGRCQELIPPLPIWEDEEKEVGTCDVLESRLKELTNVADMVAARTRQLSHRLKGRRAAILDRRAEGGSGTPAKANTQQTTTAPPANPSAGFTAVNAAGARLDGEAPEPLLGANAAVRTELLRHFESLPHNQGQGRSSSFGQGGATAPEAGVQPASIAESTGHEHHTAGSTTSSLSPVPAGAFPADILSYYTEDGHSASRPAHTHRPSSSSGANKQSGAHSSHGKHNFSRPLPAALESTQPFRPLCQAHMDGLPRGQRVLPPCDRCRRLRMDCVKNLTSCAGCTRKHARCHWRDVTRDELGSLDHMLDASLQNLPDDTDGLNGYDDSNPPYPHGHGYRGERSDDEEDSEDDDSNPLEDLEALGEKEEREEREEADRMAAARLREDEEGLQNARELARQGWQEGLRERGSRSDVEEEDGTGESETPGEAASGTDAEADHEGQGEGDTNGAPESTENHAQAVADHLAGLADPTPTTNGLTNGHTHPEDSNTAQADERERRQSLVDAALADPKPARPDLPPAPSPAGGGMGFANGHGHGHEGFHAVNQGVV